jgi:hypothetical protein
VAALDWIYQLNLAILYPMVIVLIAAAGEFGHQIGMWLLRSDPKRPDLGVLTGAALGLLALLLSFSFSIALSRFDARRTMVLEEANAISSTANFALMLPQPGQGAILALLRDYAAVRIDLGIPFGQSKLQQDTSRSLEFQAQLWRQAVAITDAAPQSLPAYRFVASLNEMNNIHERRITALRYHVPAPVVLMLMIVAIVAMGFAGYNAGITGARRLLPHLVMSVTAAVLIVLVIDLDSPNHGLIQVPVQALVDAERGIPPQTVGSAIGQSHGAGTTR